MQRTLKSVQPERLMIVFWRQCTSVEKDKNDDKPVERLWFDDSPTELATPTVGPMKPTTIDHTQQTTGAFPHAYSPLLIYMQPPTFDKMENAL